MSSAQMIMTGVALDYPNALVDSVITKQSTGQNDKGTAQPEPLGKCINPATGKPVSARREDEAVFPVDGSKVDSADGNGTGTCPECSAHVKLSGKGFLTAHNVRKESIPAPPPAVRLAERQTIVTDTGVRSGSPDKVERARKAELSGHQYQGWHPPMVVVDNGATVALQMRRPKVDAEGNPVRSEKTGNPLTTTETVRVPATEANVRTALRQEQRKKQRTSKKTGEVTGGPDVSLLATLGRMLKGLTGLEAVGTLGAEPGTYKVREAVTVDAPNAPEGREERIREDGTAGHVATSPGPALVQGRSMSGEIPTERDRTTAKGKPRNAVGWGGPLGRPRPDQIAVVGNAEACQGKGCTLTSCSAVVGDRHGYLECHVFRALSKAQKRRYWANVATNRARDERAREYARRPKAAGGYGHGGKGTAVSKAAIQRV